MRVQRRGRRARSTCRRAPGPGWPPPRGCGGAGRAARLVRCTKPGHRGAPTPARRAAPPPLPAPHGQRVALDVGERGAPRPHRGPQPPAPPTSASPRAWSRLTDFGAPKVRSKAATRDPAACARPSTLARRRVAPGEHGRRGSAAADRRRPGPAPRGPDPSHRPGRLDPRCPVPRRHLQVVGVAAAGHLRQPKHLRRPSGARRAPWAQDSFSCHFMSSRVPPRGWPGPASGPRLGQLRWAATSWAWGPSWSSTPANQSGLATASRTRRRPSAEVLGAEHREGLGHPGAAAVDHHLGHGGVGAGDERGASGPRSAVVGPARGRRACPVRRSLEDAVHPEPARCRRRGGSSRRGTTRPRGR